jgi:TonB family protein
MRISFVALLLSFSAVALANTSPTQDRGSSDIRLSQRLVGEWESKFEKKTTSIKQVFVSLDSRTHFKIVRIAEFPGHRGRIEYEGKWRVSNGELVLEPGKERTFEGESSQSGAEKDRIISVGKDVVVLRTIEGAKRELVRTPIPSLLPPLLPRDSLAKATAIYAPKPDYPLEARMHRWTGKGMIILDVDQNTGFVRAARMIKSTGHAILDNAAISAFSRWRFEPGQVKEVKVPINFTMSY